jgi:tripartite-type tricarboxylate transporter receptor subunit TctC
MKRCGEAWSLQRPYKGNGQGIGNLIGGHVSMMVLSLSPILGNVKTGKLFALAVTTPDRSKLLPDVPTIAESAVPGLPPSAMGLWRPPVHRRPSSSGCRANCVLR